MKRWMLPIVCLHLCGPCHGQERSREIEGKVVCGYQGWFTCGADGADLGWRHWTKNHNAPPGPGNVSIDLWPDLREAAADERYPTGFKWPDGSVAEVFSSHDRGTVERHFEWMRDYGIDGVFLQRFGNGLPDPAIMKHKNAVLANVRHAAEEAGRSYAIMYDLSGMGSGALKDIQSDWEEISEIVEDETYLRRRSKPLVAIWGVGFSDGRDYTLEECGGLVDYFKNAGCAVMLGIPSWWREGRRDALASPGLREILARADILSPWTVGRYRTPDQAAAHARDVWSRDMEWCEERGILFLPVAFPGFSWKNLHGGKIGEIPRLRGGFLWSQFAAARRVGCRTIYVAMFDEVDEGTAIFKCVDGPGNGDFVGMEGVASDFYLKLTGAGGRMLSGELPLSDVLPRKFGR